MINLENYRSSTEYREILRILQKATNLQDNLLWQSNTQGKTVIPVLYIEIDFIAREVLVKFNSTEHLIDSHRPLYFKLEYRSSIFKISHFRQNQDSLHFSFPELIKTPEFRDIPRHQFRPAQEKYVVLRSANLKEPGGELKIRSMDISQTGLGLVLSEQNRNFMKNNRLVWITSLEDCNLEEPVLAEVVYMNSEVDPSFVIKKQKFLKVGLRISGAFPEEAYSRFLQ